MPMFERGKLKHALLVALGGAGMAGAQATPAAGRKRVPVSVTTAPQGRTKAMLASVMALGGCLTLANCASGPPPGEPISGEAYISAWRGNTSVGRTRDGANFWTYLTPAMEQRGAANYLGRETRYVGQIRVSGNTFCSQSPQLRGGEERCFEIRRDGDTFRTYFNGELWTTATFSPGNPRGL
jgi:hypothetical protein